MFVLREVIHRATLLGLTMTVIGCSVAGADPGGADEAPASDPAVPASPVDRPQLAGTQPKPAAPVALAALGVPHIVRAEGASDTGFSAAFAPCPSGEVALGGGGQSNTVLSFGGGPAYVILSDPRPAADGVTPIGWDTWVSAVPGFTGTVTATAYVICAAVTR